MAHGRRGHRDMGKMSVTESLLPSQDPLPSGGFHRKQIRMRALPVTAVTITLLMLLGGAYYLGGRRGALSTRFKETIKERGPSKLMMHWAGEPVTLQVDNAPGRDACVLLSECFKTSAFTADPVANPNNPLAQCHRSVRTILAHYDSGFVYEGERLVAFISSDFKNGASHGHPFSHMSLYNVCVGAEQRGRGVAKRLLPEYIDTVLQHRLPVANRPPGHRVYVGLDVDFDSETAVSAFSLYAKLGFVRWWEPCWNIAEFDFWRLEHQHELAHPATSTSPTIKTQKPSVLFPMSQYWMLRPETLKEQLFDRIRSSHRRGFFSHFCMVKRHDDGDMDTFESFGQAVKDEVQRGLAVRRASFSSPKQQPVQAQAQAREP